jgi:hypothetical protein
MKRIRIPGLVDIAIVDDAAEVESLSQNTSLDRAYADRSTIVNGLILRRICDTLQQAGKRFPTISPRQDAERAAAQKALSERLRAMSYSLTDGPDELEPLARWVRGEGETDACGPLIQDVVGKLFNPAFRATAETWDAALLLNQAPRCANPALLAWWALTHKVDRAKQLLSDAMQGDLAGVHAIGIAVHNIVNGLQAMRELYRDPQRRAAHSAEQVLRQCIFAPDTVLRQPVCPVVADSQTLNTATVLLLKLQDANAAAPSSDVAFLSNSWSECPASHWVPALLQGTWNRATRPVEPAKAFSQAAPLH